MYLRTCQFSKYLRLAFKQAFSGLGLFARLWRPNHGQDNIISCSDACRSLVLIALDIEYFAIPLRSRRGFKEYIPFQVLSSVLG